MECHYTCRRRNDDDDDDDDDDEVIWHALKAELLVFMQSHLAYTLFTLEACRAQPSSKNPNLFAHPVSLIVFSPLGSRQCNGRSYHHYPP